MAGKAGSGFQFEQIQTDDPALRQALVMLGRMRDYIFEQLRQLGAEV